MIIYIHLHMIFSRSYYVYIEISIYSTQLRENCFLERFSICNFLTELKTVIRIEQPS